MLEITRVVHVFVRRVDRGCQVETPSVDVSLAVASMVISFMQVVRLVQMRAFELGTRLIGRLRSGGGHRDLRARIKIVGVVVLFSTLAVRERRARYVVRGHGDVGADVAAAVTRPSSTPRRVH